ncbi:hypothetical protein KBK19_16795 [Microvirga sp. STR05]|uniref:DUF1376 domain-containing protein n=1 Tax=Hymenobacter duratus TaxID=2771356 RepID=A0ABR8JLE4_9BACT|nr:hypothetical protein [Hymenobacter duratus]MBD2716705.1 hypothetical protein [Hymenobacter duratus]MBR7951620.1 hypothetical protein [Microvirga sp. STR05]
MNYVAHTRAAHEHLRTCPGARPQHVSLYWALFFEWNAARFPARLDLNHEQLMLAARIGNRRTYRATLYDLDAWGLLTYQPSQSRYQESRCVLLNLSGADVPLMKAGTGGSSAPPDTTLSRAEVAKALRADVPYMTPSSGAKEPQDTLYAKTVDVNLVVVNGDVALHQKKIEVLEGEWLSGAELLDNTAPPDGAGLAPKMPPRIKPGAPKEVRSRHLEAVGQYPPAPAPRAAAGRGRTTLPDLPFSQSPLADVSAFVQAFQGTDYELADLRHYHQLVATWRDRKTGEEPRRKDWVATAKRFMLNDAADNRLKLAPNVQRRPDGSLYQQPAGSVAAGTGYVSKWDR